MVDKPIQGEKRVFMTGNEVIAWGAVAAQAEVMYGYPITPQNEVMHYWTRLAPKFDKGFLQTEDELSAGFATIGGVLAGRKCFTGTAGPGNTLMQEPFSMAEMMRIPIVGMILQRGGPSTATVIYSQQEVTLTTFGGNGEGHRIVYSPCNHQELFDYTIKSFNTAWKYRFPTFLLADGYQAKMREPLVMYDPEERGIEMVKPEVTLGNGMEKGYYNHVRNTFNTEEELYDIVMDMENEFQRVAPEIIEYQEFDCDGDMDVLIIAHGVVSRAAQAAVQNLREEGYKTGHFRPITLRPFPVEELRATAQRAKKILIVESAIGQLGKLIKEALHGLPVVSDTLYRPGVGITSDEVVEKVKAIADK
ncbi:transketolase C-terminal domain-containing protein [Desulfuribacillus alkaliarsenatis]|uniref:Ferredoxin oxidoreductase n=1 Tax=Desulfuribacillus alkaliarsenatis TaxID=766136 RepID=A0A1E5FYT5_9FIRM|nr:transketolase C-terminal domain-containing protein [Desulfuribacillus alkaliarsenatis]OEF95730.1 ferredoxin oxidoreductase [Desulfuribacillus alkaliarsenatis]